MSDRGEIRATGLLVDAWGCHYESREWVQASDYDQLRAETDRLRALLGKWLAYGRDAGAGDQYQLSRYFDLRDETRDAVPQPEQ